MATTTSSMAAPSSLLEDSPVEGSLMENIAGTQLKTSNLLGLLQLSDSFFPLGAFSFSDGLEAAIQAGWVGNSDQLGEWLLDWLHTSFLNFEGPALRDLDSVLNEFSGKKLWVKIAELDEEIGAMKPSSATRASSKSLGKRMLQTCLPLRTNPLFNESASKLLLELKSQINADNVQGHLTTVQAILFHEMRVSIRDSLASVAYSKLAGMVSAALRLMSVGQAAGQMLLTTVLKDVPDVIEAIVFGDAPPSSFTPMVDIAQMSHPQLYTRLFRS